MGLSLTYKNSLGAVKMYGRGKGNIRICKIEGLGLVQNEYTATTNTGRIGQNTISHRVLPRTITLALEAIGSDIAAILRDALKVLSQEGMLYISNEGFFKRIYCNQVQIPDIESVQKGKISTFAVQFVCDNPYFEDGEDITVPLYKRTKRLATPFTMPCVFGEIVAGANLWIDGAVDTEPQITMYYPTALAEVENITICNETIDKSICLNYTPMSDDKVTIDVKNRSITSSKSGNLLSFISNNTFLGDFVLVPGDNRITVDLGDVTADFTIECRYSNLYQEAVVV